MEKYSELREAVKNVAVIDAHCHNLVAMNSSFPFLRCFSNAEGGALTDAFNTLFFKRSIRDIAELYNCNASLTDVEGHRNLTGFDAIGSKCFSAANISAIFIDDGVDFDKKREWECHSRFVPAVGRIIRIEHLAEKILNEELQHGSKITLESFTELFLTNLKSFSNSVVAMKSMGAYKSGLKIDTHVSMMAVEEGLLEDFNAKRPVQIQNKNLIDYIFKCSLKVALQFNLPMQIHTGFGDTNSDLKKCNLLLLRELLEDKRFSKCRFVLLHASYPFSKEASYLASIYSQVYLDIGLTVNKISVHGMKSSIKEILELAPINKVMFSSGGYAFPETFYLGVKRARDVIYSVLTDACDDGDLTIPEAIRAAEGIFNKNALNFYKSDKFIGSLVGSHSLDVRSKVYVEQPKDITFVRLVWADTCGQRRCRVVPSKRFYDITKNNGVGLTRGAMAMASFSDAPVDYSDLTPVGEIRIIPDMSTKHRIPWSKHEEMVLVDMHIRPGEPWEYCPRNTLRRVSKILKEEFNLVMNAGFENEFYLLRNIVREGVEQWVPFDSSHYCCSSGFDAASPIMQEMFSCLHSMGIIVEQLHGESGYGQFEIATGHARCIHSADNLIFVREAVRAVARKHGFLVTFLPKYFSDSIGSGSHVHLSLWENGQNVFIASDLTKSKYGMSKIGEKFMAGVFHHLPSILAIIAPLPNSYDRIQPNMWSGAHHIWGIENREAPIRAACPPGISSGYVSNFEIKSFDACANPHFGLASIMAAGIDGLRKNISLPEPIDVNPSTLEVEPKRLPTNLNESVAALENNFMLKEILGEKLVDAILAVRKAEIIYYGNNKSAAKQLIHKF
ncbi:hypothetical protein ZOSMA_75G00310 [Zostera marina]|uniref:GS catalytic domain-containing protein n=1 Tax=Zostera marina TaxID=29655 RepID=A0A0K9NPU0_ZOSMR|nr:hypothetical protein ZOSMA_75G00310 [Zostera marina]